MTATYPPRRRVVAADPGRRPLTSPPPGRCRRHFATQPAATSERKRVPSRFTLLMPTPPESPHSGLHHLSPWITIDGHKNARKFCSIFSTHFVEFRSNRLLDDEFRDELAHFGAQVAAPSVFQCQDTAALTANEPARPATAHAPGGGRWSVAQRIVGRNSLHSLRHHPVSSHWRYHEGIGNASLFCSRIGPRNVGN